SPARADDRPARPLCRVHRVDAEAARRAAADPRAAAVPSRRVVRPHRGEEGLVRLKRLLEALAFVVLVAVVVVMPRLVSDFHARELALVGVYFIALIGLNVLTGYSGQISLGHGAFMAIGGYTTAILTVDHGVRDLWTIPIAGAIAGFAGLLVGIPALRLSGLYLAIVTFGIAVSFRQLLIKYRHFTGGTSGKIMQLAKSELGIHTTQARWLYYLTWTIA